MFEEDGFYIDDDELGEENQMTIVDDAIYKCLEAMEKSLVELKNNLKFNETQDQANSLKILAMHLDSAITLATIDQNGLSDEEVSEEIQKVLKQTTELTFANMNLVLPPSDEELEGEANSTPKLNPGDLDGSTDW